MNDESHQPSKRWYPGYVYVIDYGDGKTFKVGSTIGNPEGRLKQIVGSSVIMPMHLVMAVYTETNCTWLENLVHMQLDNKHISGEWFTLDFVDLVEVYQMLTSFGGVEMYDDWWNLVDEDYQKYIDHGAISSNMPLFEKLNFYEVFGVN
jgi:hypothetical protein